ncbi:MAG: (d)CMP kinase [Coxiellaceae bacterium]|nr:MAG: (d)CMP kinase [Coxiellaceae bacterium]
MQPLQAPIITIDGPGGTGKGTISHILAKKLGWHFLDSGVLYRILALAAKQAHIAWDDAAKLAVLANQLQVTFVPAGIGDSPIVLLNHKDVTNLIRTEECGQGASQVGVFPEVRTALLARQRAFCQPPGLVTDGRDMGTVVFPNAELKFFAGNPEERAKRRYNQLHRQGINVSLQQVLQELNSRDQRDSSRAIAPLQPAADAVIIDTTHLTVDQVLEKVLAEVSRRFGSEVFLPMN